MKKNIIFFLFIISSSIHAQDTLLPKINFSGFVDVYASYNFSDATSNEKPNFLYNHTKNNQLALNLTYAKANIVGQEYRANFALMTGTYALRNLSAEPSMFQHIYEANVGIQLSKKNNTWLDIGIMPSHIGFESAVSSDCYTLTRSILAENSPYFETGAKLTFNNKKNNLATSILVLNGWQNIEKKEGYNNPALGFQINYKPTDKITYNYSNFIGSVYPDSLNVLRTYHNTYVIYEPNKVWNYIVGFDIGTQNSTVWYSPVIIVRKSLTEKSKIAIRYQYFNDANEQQIKTFIEKGFIINSLSLNYDYQFNQHFFFRCELSKTEATESVFNNKKNSFIVTTCVAVKF